MPILIEQHSAQACTIFVVRGSFQGTVSSKAFRAAVLEALPRIRTLILVDFSALEYVDEFGVESILAVSFAVSHRSHSIAFFGLSEMMTARFQGAGMSGLALEAQTIGAAYDELCSRRREQFDEDDAPSFDILQFVREEAASGEA